jgi:hypothetical protein
MNHNHTPHPMALQRSKYLCVDDSIEKNYVLTTNEKRRKNKNSSGQELNLRFCHETEVN